MAVTLQNYGKADWTDYVDNWRDDDAEWLQDRIVTRYQTPQARDAGVGQPVYGQVVYNEETDRLELFSRLKNSWVPQISLQWLYVVKDESTGVTIAHRDSGGKGMTFKRDQISFDIAVDNNGVLKVVGVPAPVEQRGITIQTGSVAARLYTDAASLISSAPFSTPGLTVTGPLNASGQNLTVGTLTATTVAVSGAITGAATISGSQATIGGVKIGVVANQVEASAGFISQGGAVIGDADGVTVQTKTGSVKLDVSAAGVSVEGSGTTLVKNAFQIDNSVAPVRNARWLVPGTPDGYLAPVVFSTTAIDPAQYPIGTIWVQ